MILFLFYRYGDVPHRMETLMTRVHQDFMDTLNSDTKAAHSECLVLLFPLQPLAYFVSSYVIGHPTTQGAVFHLYLRLTLIGDQIRLYM